MVMNRLEDIWHDEPIPSGCVAIFGKRLMATARAQKVPYGRIANRKVVRETIGIIVHEDNLNKMDKAILAKLLK